MKGLGVGRKIKRDVAKRPLGISSRVGVIPEVAGARGTWYA